MTTIQMCPILWWSFVPTSAIWKTVFQSRLAMCTSQFIIRTCLARVIIQLSHGCGYGGQGYRLANGWMKPMCWILHQRCCASWALMCLPISMANLLQSFLHFKPERVILEKNNYRMSNESKMIHKSAIVETDRIGNNVRIDAFALVHPGTVIGDDVVIHAHAVVSPGVVLGDGVEVYPGAFVGKEPKAPGTLLRPPVYEPRVTIAANSLIGPNAVIYYDVDIGERTLIGDGVSIREQCRIGRGCKIGPNATLNYNVRVGDGSQVSNLVHAAGNTVIGRRVFIAAGVSMANDNHFGRAPQNEAQRIAPRVEDDCRIGPGAVLLPEVVIGRNAIVGAGAVVSKDVQSGTLVMGVPARFVRHLNTEER